MTNAFQAIYRKLVPLPTKPLDEETVLVTGAGHGIGRHIALQLAAEHGVRKIVCWDINQKSCDDTARDYGNAIDDDSSIQVASASLTSLLTIVHASFKLLPSSILNTFHSLVVIVQGGEGPAARKGLVLVDSVRRLRSRGSEEGGGHDEESSQWSLHRTSLLLRLSDSDFEWCLSSFRAQCGRVTMLINNAGILPARPFLDFSDGETIRKIFEVNTYSQVSALSPKHLQVRGKSWV